MTATIEIDREAMAAEVYENAIAYAKSLVPFGDWEAEEIAINAATDAVLWCLDRAERQTVNDWPAFVTRQVRKTVERDMENHGKRLETRRGSVGEQVGDDEIEGLDDLADRRSAGHVGPDGRLPIDLADCLTPEQAEAVRLRFVDGYSEREAADRAGISRTELQRRIKEAAYAVAGARPAAVKAPGRKQFCRWESQKGPKTRLSGSVL